MNTDFKTRLVDAATQVMVGEKCDCPDCDCHYTREDAEKLISAIAPLVVDECAKAVHADLASRLALR